MIIFYNILGYLIVLIKKKYLNCKRYGDFMLPVTGKDLVNMLFNWLCVILTDKVVI